MDLDAKAQVDLGRSLALSETEIALPSGDVNLNGLLPRVVSSDGFDATPGAEGALPRLGLGTKGNDGYVVYEWRLPSGFEHPLTVKSLDLRWRLSEPPEENNFIVGFYDWQSARWSAFQSGQSLKRDGTVTIDKPSQIARFFEPGTGTVRVQLSSKSTRDVAIEHIALSAAARVEAR